MVKLRKRSESIRNFILENVSAHPTDIVNFTVKKFQITRQAINKHIHQLIEQKSLEVKGSTKNRQYTLSPRTSLSRSYPLDGSTEEDMVWRNDVRPLLGILPDNVIDIWHYGFTEILNNAIEHSSGRQVSVIVTKNASGTRIVLHDDGIGIFRKIQEALDLADESHAVLELAKGKLTTDPKHHSGEGIFFSSRMFDHFSIQSGNVNFSHNHSGMEDWVSQTDSNHSGTIVFMELKNNTSRTEKEIFDTFTSDDTYGFTKTVVPVRLAQYDQEKLVSRSQAKRMLARLDRFKIVIFDFNGVESIGQSFADEVFRVFRNKHPDMEILHVNANENVKQMISRAMVANE